jgi:hypothetical protein
VSDAVLSPRAAPDDRKTIAKATAIVEPHFDAEGRFIHHCSVCGKDVGFGVGVSLHKGQLGTWFCLEHWRAWKVAKDDEVTTEPERGTP